MRIDENPCPCGTQRCYPEHCDARKLYESCGYYDSCTPNINYSSLDIVQYIIVRRDLSLSYGKLAVQCCHASMGIVLEHQNDLMVKTWLRQSFTKVILGIKNLYQLNKLLTKLNSNAILYKVIVDNGLTEVTPNTLTCIGIKPMIRTEIQPLLSKLQLY